jgi:pyridoxamine 5'-phosphate oxidase
MIDFINDCKDEPFVVFKNMYKEAIYNNQIAVEAISISSWSNILQEVDSRYVNLKVIDNKNFIFFSNYKSSKAKQFKSHDQIAAVVYWSSINVQIRIKAKIIKTSSEYNQKYFAERSIEKNALAISSSQSKPIDSYNQVKENYNKSLKNDDLKKCPEFWGGYSFTPYYFEFWEGHESRLNKREVFEKKDDRWKHLFLQP